MTVHGAKGLEAPVVVILDGCEPLGRNDPPLLPLAADGAAVPPVWSSGRTQDCAATEAARAALLARARQEHNRLLYVAMTRAADRLIVAPFRGHERETEAAWCRMVRAGLEATLGAGRAVELSYGPATVWQDGARRPARPRCGRPRRRPRRSRTGCAAGSAGAGAPDPQPVRRAPGGGRRARAAAAPGGCPGPAARHPDPRAAAASAPGRAGAPGGGRARLRAGAGAGAARGRPSTAIVRSVLRIIDDPDLAPLFAPDARAEVSLSGRVRTAVRERPVQGRVDRLSVTADTVRIADFKTGRPPEPEAPLPPAEAGQIAALRPAARPDLSRAGRSGRCWSGHRGR